MLFSSICNRDDSFWYAGNYLGLVCSFALVWKCANTHLQDCLLLSLSWNITDYFRTRSCSSAVAFGLPQQEVAGSAGLSCACSSSGLQAGLPGCCSSTALRNRLPAALLVHQGTFMVLPHAGLARVLGHRSHELVIHQPWQLGQF